MLSLCQWIALAVGPSGSVMSLGEPKPYQRRRDGQPTAGLGVSKERCVPVPVCGSAKMERFPQISSVLEGNVVVSYRGGRLRAALFAGDFSAGFLPMVPRTEQDNVPRDTLRPVLPFATLFVFPARRLELAFDVDLRAFTYVLANDLRQTLPSHNAMPFCPVLPCVVSVFESLIGGKTRSEEHTSELQSLAYLVCRLLLEKKKMSHRTI